MLDALTALARLATRQSSKRRVVERLIRRTSEPVICFTEFRDTLQGLVEYLAPGTSVAVLHGGLDRAERRDAVARFTSGDVRLLLATDAAAEGLNLQARCRVLVNIELPWSPRVLEQRAGRIDRIGQQRPVRVWELCGRSSHEGPVVAALARRAAAIATDLGADEPTEGDGAGLTVRTPLELLNGIAPATLAAWSSLRADSEAAGAAREARRRGPIWMRARDRSLGRGIVLIFTAGPGVLGSATEHVAVHVAMRALPPGSPGDWLPLVVNAAAPVAAGAVGRRPALAQSLSTRETELLEFARAAHDESGRRWQPSFFDRRAERAVDAARVDFTRLVDEHERRILELGRADVPRLDPLLALVVR
jgi:hypothetical protein